MTFECIAYFVLLILFALHYSAFEFGKIMNKITLVYFPQTYTGTQCTGQSLEHGQVWLEFFVKCEHCCV